MVNIRRKLMGRMEETIFVKHLLLVRHNVFCVIFQLTRPMNLSRTILYLTLFRQRRLEFPIVVGALVMHNRGS